MKWKIPLFESDIGPAEVAAVTSVMKSGWLTMGHETGAFENKFASYLGVKHAFMVANCTAALHLAHSILGAKNGDEVICPSLTFVATASSIVQTGARPVFADIVSPDIPLISPVDIRKKITAKTKGLVVVHYAGYPCDMAEIMAIAAEYGLYVVEDCAHSPGASYKGKMTGTIGDIGCFSFFSNKNLSTGEGGMIVTDRDDVAERIRLLLSHGMTSLTLDRFKGHAFTYDVMECGYNYRSSEINAAIGRVQLAKLDRKNKKREKLTGEYIQRLAGFRGAKPLFKHLSKNTRSAYHIFTVLLKEGTDRNSVMAYMKEKGIQTSIHYPPVHTFTAYRVYKAGKGLPVTEAVKDRILTLPLFPAMKESQIDYIVDVLKTAV